jgi:hypothetical protein
MQEKRNSLEVARAVRKVRNSDKINNLSNYANFIKARAETEKKIDSDAIGPHRKRIRLASYGQVNQAV